MDSLSYSVNATMPVFLVMVIGWMLMKIGMLKDEKFLSVANKFIFNVSLPVMLFIDMWETDVKSDFDLKLVVYSAIITTIAFAGIWIFAKLCLEDKAMIGAFVQAAYRSSVAVLGVAFMTNIYGSASLIPMIIIGSVPLYNIYAVIVLTIEGEDAQNLTNKKALVKKTVMGVITNPIIIGIVIGTIASLINLQLPTIAYKTLNSVAQICSPLSLIVIGASFEGKKAIAKVKPALICSMIKLIIMPAAFLLPAAFLFGFRDEALTALVIMLGSPSTPSCYIMAKNMKNDTVLTSSVIAMTTLASSITLTFWIFLMRYLDFM